MSLPDNMPAQTRSKDRAAYAALSKKNHGPDWAKIDAAAEAARKKKYGSQRRSGYRFHNVGEEVYPGTGTHEDGKDTRKRKGGKNGYTVSKRRSTYRHGNANRSRRNKVPGKH